jgi:hypothetical protein
MVFLLGDEGLGVFAAGVSAREKFAVDDARAVPQRGLSGRLKEFPAAFARVGANGGCELIGPIA